MTGFAIASLYKFVPLPDCAVLRDRLWDVCREHEIVGTLILADEGINGTVAGSPGAMQAVLDHLAEDPRFSDLEPKKAVAEVLPFLRLKVLLKSEIVTMGWPVPDAGHPTGTHVDPAAWNGLLQDPDVLVLDCRNRFEVEVGTFRGSTDPGLHSFTDFPSFVRARLDPDRDRHIAMFCTGGIRCEKASTYMLERGFDTVQQLRGGILNYLEKVSETDSEWRGECFVFDRRVTLQHGLRAGTFRECHGCKSPTSADDRNSPLYEFGVSCPRCHAGLTEERRVGLRERVRQVQLAEGRRTPHLGAPWVAAPSQ